MRRTATRRTCSVKGAGRDAHHRRPEPRGFRHPDQPRGLSEARRLPPHRAPGDEVHRGRGEVLRGGVRGRAERGHRRPDVRSLLQHAGRVRARCSAAAIVEPSGKDVPGYLLEGPLAPDPACGRYFINSADAPFDYGTRAAFPSWIYPEDGNRFFPGTDASALAGHTGGDVWVADAAIEMMNEETWSGMFVTLGAIDKAAHMWGAQADAANFTGDCNDPDPAIRGANQTHVRCAAEIADVQLGKLRDAVSALDASDGGETLVVLTADHGATYRRARTSTGGRSPWVSATPTGTTRPTACGTRASSPIRYRRAGTLRASPATSTASRHRLCSR